MVEENRGLTPQDLKPFLVYAWHLGFKTSIRNKKRHLQSFLVEVTYLQTRLWRLSGFSTTIPSMNDPEINQICMHANKLFLHVFFLGLWTEHIILKPIKQSVRRRRWLTSRLFCAKGPMWNFINYHIWLMTSPDSIIAKCFQTSLSQDLARGGGGWNSG